MQKTYIYWPNPYYEGEETYVQIPRLLFEPPYDDLSDDAKVLYGILLDKVEVSYDHPDRWIDNGRAYIYYTRKELMEYFGVKQEKATKTFQELEKRGFIERKRQEFGKPAKIYLNDYWSNPENIPASMNIYENPSFSGPKRRIGSFYNIPWTLFMGPYKALSNSARLLYALLRKNMDGQRKHMNLRKDEESAYIHYQVEKVMKTFHVAEKKAVKTFRELEKANLIKRDRQGLGKPAKIRINKPITIELPADIPAYQKPTAPKTSENVHRTEKDKSHPIERKRTSQRAEKDNSTYIIYILLSTLSINLSAKPGRTPHPPERPANRELSPLAEKR